MQALQDHETDAVAAEREKFSEVVSRCVRMRVRVCVRVLLGMDSWSVRIRSRRSSRHNRQSTASEYVLTTNVTYIQPLDPLWPAAWYVCPVGGVARVMKSERVTARLEWCSWHMIRRHFTAHSLHTPTPTHTQTLYNTLLRWFHMSLTGHT